ncbi:uncharacterized protein B0P05DRAFT_554974 [Gilbertella persicaria]|uniref:uncharacterized protein n=1 Tax=Gilbertella persicaria TaxID=101096 RepID=UPI00221E4B3D|nr:uncharacterized protein B0P05DRAFT_554974 [Gilbertella persicaria]KAI8064324.1 hypothetical protein B0P05DRAFT_554974 [Gilbertella persicaria]
MTSIEQLGLETVVNKQEFQSSVVIKDCPIVGRSLVAKKPLVPGDIVLVEEPLIQYDLEPKCRSNKSPYYSKKLWKILKDMVYAEEGIDTQLNTQQPNKSDESDESDESEDDMETTVHSDFYPGVPAAIIAYSLIHPPPSYNNARRRKEYSQNDFDFFYFPNTDIEPAWLDHKTIKLIHTVTQKVVDTVPLYAHVDPFDLRSFVLKIYSNAHTVSLPRIRTAPTHASRRSRREKYKTKFGDTTYWGEDAVEPPNTPTIALLRWGSKFAHSCSPNMFLRFEPQRNVMVFTVTKPLAEGDILSFSYLPEDDSTVGGLVYGATPDRQAKLDKFKFFKCACERCLDWDWARGADCPDCQGTAYCQGTWTCFACGSHNQPSFVGEREKQVENTVMGFVSRVYGGRMTQHTMRMLEPYLTDLLEQGVPKHHWLYAVIHSLLATYHLTLFPQSYGKGLASQLGLTVKGLEESLVYLEFLDTIYAPKHPQATYTGNAMAAFFASWRTLSVVIDLVMTSTEDKYAHSDSDEPVLIPLAQDWIQPVTRMSNIVDKEWIPLVKQVFRSHAVVQDMIKQIKAFSQRIHL